jgi:hypothetical protein
MRPFDSEPFPLVPLFTADLAGEAGRSFFRSKAEGLAFSIFLPAWEETGGQSKGLTAATE